MQIDSARDAADGDKGEYAFAADDASSPPRVTATGLDIEALQQRVAESLEPTGEPFQVTLAELLGLMTAIAVFMSAVSLIPIGTTVERIAGMAGLTLLVFMIVLELKPQIRPIFRLAWWIGLMIYMVVCLIAVLKP